MEMHSLSKEASSSSSSSGGGASNAACSHATETSSVAPPSGSHSAFVAAAVASGSKASKHRAFHSHRHDANRTRASTDPAPQRSSGAKLDGLDDPMFADRPVITDSEQAMLCDDICMLCDACLKNSNGRTTPGVQLDAPPGSRRWQKLPCLCPDRYLHVTCLEAAFFDANILRAAGGRKLRLSCPVCCTGLRVTRQRGRRTCDHQACLSFFRHLLSVLLISAFLIAFGLWSIFYDGRLTPNAVNIALIVIGGVILLVFAIYEMWLLHGRFEFVIVRLASRPASVGGSGGTGRRGSGSGRGEFAVIDTEGPPAVARCNPTTVQS